ncbi:serine/threonine-protein kinase Sgk2 [Pochonia chlamydosporia 170]|uniref:Serine/threonine-protein kinase Sgk2 n=1 Tax=Pochonia chlamydosporia 170 TaxID=1380566 RepID=A0A179EZI0_METCM|nr:serine/threonine-protein kinase Sgk2 [Pochonia chlamydosporia 170]OAQ58309.2 serine/threonine-protein kinase Sgk2 [Pochonia chlamydosporia 170]
MGSLIPFRHRKVLALFSKTRHHKIIASFVYWPFLRRGDQLHRSRLLSSSLKPFVTPFKRINHSTRTGKFCTETVPKIISLLPMRSMFAHRTWSSP